MFAGVRRAQGNEYDSATDSSLVSVRDALAMASVVAILTGLLHNGVLQWRVAVGREFVWQSRDHLWMAPIAYLLLFTALAIAGSIAARAARRAHPSLDARRWFAALLAFAGALALVLLWPRLHWAAQLSLAAGIAAQASGPLGRVKGRLMSRAAIVLAGIVILLGAGSRARRAIIERRALSQLSPASDGAPNVLLIILDTVRAASVSLHGYAQPTTPALDLLGGEGIVFDRAISTSPWTLPSHGSIFTGREADAIPVSWRVPLDTRARTLAEVFGKRGYTTAGFVANTYYAGHDSGLERGFIRYDDYRTSLTQIVRSSTYAQLRLAAELGGSRTWRHVLSALRRADLSMEVMPASHRKEGAVVTDDFLDWQSGADGRPFFAFLNYFDAHEVYAPPPEYDALFAAPNRKQQRYEGAIRYLDDQLRRLFDTLGVRGVLDKTIIVVTSDHGELFGEHGRWGHGNAMFMEALHVPLVVRYPSRAPAGIRVGAPVTLRDLGATLLDLSGIAGESFPGRSLARHWSAASAPATPEAVKSSLSSFEDAWLPLARQRTMESIITGELHWIRGMDGTETLYDIRSDPGEQKDVWHLAETRARFDASRRSR